MSTKLGEAQVEKIFGRDLANLRSFQNHSGTLSKIFINNPKCPPTTTGTNADVAQEFCSIISDALFYTKFLDSNCVTFENKSEVINKIIEYLFREEDEYELIAPVGNLTISSPITFSFGELTPIDWDMAVELLKTKSDRPEFSMGTVPSKFWDTVNCAVLMKIKCKSKRTAATSSFNQQVTLQRLQINLENLLRLYCYGGPNTIWSHYYLNGVSKRSLSSSTPGRSSSGHNKNLIENQDKLVAFLNQYLSSENKISEEFEFVFDKLSEAWLSTRSINFRVFDYVSVMEALLVSSDQGEFSFRVSTMAAAFTGKTKEEKKEIFQLVKKAYDIRSKVAHCAKEIKKPLEGNEIEKLGKIAHEIMLFGFTNGIDKVREEAFSRLLN